LASNRGGVPESISTGSTSPNGAIVEANLDGSDPRVIVRGQGTARGIAVGAGHIYWTRLCGDPCTKDTGTVNVANLDGSGPKSITTGQDPYGLAAGGP
jgi:hypothetical protein